jgi:predicted anti-sigma-YlaC factor YlaD
MSDNDQSTCQAILGFLSDYVDGDLSEELCREIECHAAECEDCRIVIDTLRKTISLYHGSAAETPGVSNEAREKLFKTLNLEDYLKL